MDILADTQIVVWSFDVNSPLSQYRRTLLLDRANRVVMSYISLMELAIKKSIGKLPYFIPELAVNRSSWKTY
jgi:PIN domain nuclease of toxin-antitoxin system